MSEKPTLDIETIMRRARQAAAVFSEYSQERTDRIVREVYRAGFNQRVRLARVKQGLVDPTMTIKQVARDSGFSSVQYMTRMFRAATGETPARYRNSRKK
mgnify:CR=1 FL=1